MRALVVADVHANLAAFEAVLEHAGRFDLLWSLGDVVGYGPDPGACIALLRRLPNLAISGNHDLAAIGAIGLEEFNPFAAEAARWTAGQLTAAERAWLSGLPQIVVEGEFTLVHGSLRDPAWDYLLAEEEADEHLRRQVTPYCLVGHTHFAAVFFEGRKERLDDGARLALDGTLLVANPGSVGQPRDGDPRAAYAIVDTAAQQVEFRRAPYNVAATQAKMRAAGLPPYLTQRLARGR